MSISGLPPHSEIFITQDGSPTLIWRRNDGYAEKMHHSGGALSESFYIYHHALQNTLERGWPPRLLSVGLGLAYNELIAIGQLVRSGVADWKMWSFESEAFLRDSFRAWLIESDCALSPTYTQILTVISQRLDLSPTTLKNATRDALTTGQWVLGRAFPPSMEVEMGPITCVFYDAYSKKMHPELWVEEDLRQQLERWLDTRCVFATYAATGGLNRALRALGFSLQSRPGFLGKRESTLAIRQ